MTTRRPLLLAATLTILLAMAFVITGRPWSQRYILPGNCGGRILVLMCASKVDARPREDQVMSPRELGKAIAGGALAEAARQLSRAILDGSLREAAYEAARAYRETVERGLRAVRGLGRVW